MKRKQLVQKAAQDEKSKIPAIFDAALIETEKPKKFVVYDIALDEAEKLEFDRICEVEGLDEEIAILRMKIRMILKKHPDNVRLLMAATNMLSRLVRTRYSITKTEKKGLKEAMANVIKDIGIPLGLAAITKKL